MATKKSAVQTVIPPIDIRHATIVLESDSTLVVHAWSAKARQQILDKQMHKPAAAKGAKDPEALYQECFYRTPEGAYGFPAIAFKSAAVDACSHVSDLTKVEARGAFHIDGEIIALHDYTGPKQREDMVRIAMGTADVRIRPEFPVWQATLNIRYNASVLSLAQIANLFNVAGFSIGIGEHRPQRDGQWGMFHVLSATEAD